MASPLPTHLDPFTYNTEQAIAALSPHLHPCDAVSFRENEITGRTMLLAITITTLKTELGIVPFGRRELIVGEIKKMRRQSPLYHEHVRAMAAATPLPAPDDNEDFELEPDYSEDDVDKYIQQPVRRFTGSQFASLLNDIPPLGLQFRESPVCIRFLPENDDSESMVINTDGDLVVPEPILQTCQISESGGDGKRFTVAPATEEIKGSSTGLRESEDLPIREREDLPIPELITQEKKRIAPTFLRPIDDEPDSNEVEDIGLPGKYASCSCRLVLNYSRSHGLGRHQYRCGRDPGHIFAW